MSDPAVRAPEPATGPRMYRLLARRMARWDTATRVARAGLACLRGGPIATALTVAVGPNTHSRIEMGATTRDHARGNRLYDEQTWVCS